MRLFLALGFVLSAFAWPVLLRADTTPVSAPKPLLFYQVAHAYSSDDIEAFDQGLRAEVHDQLVSQLPAIFGTRIVELDNTPNSQDAILQLCRENGAGGVLEFADYYDDVQAASKGINTVLSVASCGGTPWFLTAGGAKKSSDRDSAAMLLEQALAQLVDTVKSKLEQHPVAAANFKRYGLYMANTDADSLWTVDFGDQATTVNYCDPVGTAYRAGLRVGDVVTAIDGIPTADTGKGKLDGIIDYPELHVGPWILTILAKDGSTNTISFENEPVSWYVAHPL